MLGVERLDPLELVLGQRERLLDEDVLARVERLQRDRRVQVVPGRDEDEVDVVVAEHLVEVGRRVAAALAWAASARAVAPVRLMTQWIWNRSRSRSRFGRWVPCAKLPAPTSATLIRPVRGATRPEPRRPGRRLLRAPGRRAGRQGAVRRPAERVVGVGRRVDLEDLRVEALEADRAAWRGAVGTRPCSGSRSSGRTRADSRRLPPRRRGRSGRGRTRSRCGSRAPSRTCPNGCRFRPTSPTRTTRPFLLHAANASRITSWLGVAAVTITASAPKPSVSSCARCTKSPVAADSPHPCRSRSPARPGAESTSTPITRQPAARSICTVS